MTTDELDLAKPEGQINHTSWKIDHENLPLISAERKDWDSKLLVPWTGKEKKWVEVVVNNEDVTGHPFHLHGFDFYLLASCTQNWGPPYNPFSSKPPRCGPYNLIDPPRKDTVYIPAKGYVALRFFADNEGIWFFHCHVLWHHAVGMAMAFQVLGDENGISSNK